MLEESEAAIWARVTAPGGTKPQPDVQAMIADERSDCATYQKLAAMTGGTCAASLRAIARDEACHAKRLTALYFVKTGACPELAPSCPLLSGCMTALLRERYLAERAGAAAYRAAAEQDPESAALFTCLAGDEAGHAKAILAMLEQLL
ncbi:MAG: hypothetical protein PHS97_06125 [Oscillospiraceae bacterium]|nr:hypothetical protein [Oscillospiraceae bacterium]